MGEFQTAGPRVKAFAENYIRQTKGRWAGKPLTLEGWQSDLLDELYLVEDGKFVYREALIGVPRKNGKSTICAAIALYGLMAMNEAGAEVYAAAASKDQARVVFDQARAFIEASPALQDWLTPMRNAIVCKETGGVFRVLSSDAPLQHGLNPSLVVIDELHAHKDPELYYALTTGQLARENPLVVSITTAGFDRESICWQVYQHGKMLEDEGLESMRSERFLFRWWAAPDDCDVKDEDAWREANPSTWIKTDDLRRECRRLPEHVFRRLHLNQWTESEEAWLPPGAWKECFEEGAHIPELADVYLGVDIGIKKDASAVVAVHKRPDGKVVPEAHVFEPKGDGSHLELELVENQIRELHDKYRVMGVVYDKWNFERSAQILSHEGVNMIEQPMGNERMVPMSDRMYQAITDQRIAHDGDRTLTAHVNAGATRDTNRGWRIDKNAAKMPNDALIALVMAFNQVDQQDSGFEVYVI